MQSTAKTFFILAQKSLRYLVLSVRKMELTCLCCLLSLSPFTSETSTLLQARQRDRDLILSYYPNLFCWNGQGRTTVLTSLWQRGLVPTLLQTPEHHKAEGHTTVDFIISAPDKIWCLIFSQGISLAWWILYRNWKPNWIGNFILPVSDSQTWRGKRGFHNQLSMSSWCAVDAKKTNAAFAKHMHMEILCRSREVTLSMYLSPIYCY